MKVIIAENKQQQKRFLKFRKQLYQNSKKYVDNNYFMLLEIFAGKLHFVQNMEILPVYITAGKAENGEGSKQPGAVLQSEKCKEDTKQPDMVLQDGKHGERAELQNIVRQNEKNDEEGRQQETFLKNNEEGRILCEGVIAYAKELPEYIQLCFFEALPGQQEAVKLLVEKTIEVGRQKNCAKLVIGLFGHVNYGLGFLDSHYEDVNSFSSLGNPEYYNQYFRAMKLAEIKLNSYISRVLNEPLKRYRAIIDKLNRNYEFRFFDRKQFDYYAKIYTDLNNACFSEHRYYYHRDYVDDAEMLKELFLFMKGDSIIYAFHKGQPVGFIMWYPDYNELARPGESFGTKHFFKNLFLNKKIRTAKVMEYGVLPEYRGSGLPMALINKVYEILGNYGCERVETSWILDENLDSNSFCREICDEGYKAYVVYEKTIGT